MTTTEAPLLPTPTGTALISFEPIGVSPYAADERPTKRRDAEIARATPPELRIHVPAHTRRNTLAVERWLEGYVTAHVGMWIPETWDRFAVHVGMTPRGTGGVIITSGGVQVGSATIALA